MVESGPEEVGSALKLEAENEYIERRETTAELKAGADSVASILNKHGVLWFGTLSDGTVVGQDVNDKTLRKVSQVIRERVSPSFDLSVDKAVFDGRPCVRVEFSGDNAPYASNKVFFIRVADEDTKMDPDQVRSVIRRQEDKRGTWDESARPAAT
ncbi:divergent AAA domain protein [Olsenella sp. DNF00959]|nr:divergent AAA domain protein [Olsenella sp. DNF00959]